MQIFRSMLSHQSQTARTSCSETASPTTSRASIRLTTSGDFATTARFTRAPKTKKTNLRWASGQSVLLNELFGQKLKFCHHLFTFISFQTYMTVFLLWNTKWDLLKHVLAAVFHAVSVMETGASKPQNKMQNHHKSTMKVVHMSIFQVLWSDMIGLCDKQTSGLLLTAANVLLNQYLNESENSSFHSLRPVLSAGSTIHLNWHYLLCSCFIPK